LHFGEQKLANNNLFYIITSIFKAFGKHNTVYASDYSYSQVLRRSVLPFNTLLHFTAP